MRACELCTCRTDRAGGGVTSMGGSSSIEADQPIRGGPSHEPAPPDDAQLRAARAALKNSSNREARQLKAAALGRPSVLAVLVVHAASIRAAVGIGFQFSYPSHTNRKTNGNPHGIPIPTEPRNHLYPYPTPCLFVRSSAFL